MSFTKHKIKLITLYFNALILFIILISIFSFARPNTVCNGREFNKRIKTMVDGGDVAVDYKIVKFERGDNPPSDSDYYIDISEDNDESVIAYYMPVNPNEKDMTKVNLYWYATDTIQMNENAALMFQGFANIKSIDLTGFGFFEGLDDTRYMFKDCRQLTNLNLKPVGYNPVNGDLFTPTEMQGMFSGCQSLKEIDLSKFNTYLVTNMSELFYKCFNLRNIYVNNPNWNITSVNNFNKMFTDCHLLRTSQGKKAVDIPDDDYEKYANLAINGVDSFLKDPAQSYIDYVPAEEYVPIEGQGFLMDIPEQMEVYSEEPEYDGQGLDEMQNNLGNATEETGVVVDAPTAQNINNATQMLENITSAVDTINDTNSITEQESIDVAETVEEGSGRKIIELDEYLNANGDKTKQDKNIIEVLWEDYQPLLITLLIIIFVLLLLIGMLLYAYKDKKGHKEL